MSKYQRLNNKLKLSFDGQDVVFVFSYSTCSWNWSIEQLNICNFKVSIKFNALVPMWKLNLRPSRPDSSVLPLFTSPWKETVKKKIYLMVKQSPNSVDFCFVSFFVILQRRLSKHRSKHQGLHSVCHSYNWGKTSTEWAGCSCGPRPHSSAAKHNKHLPRAWPQSHVFGFKQVGEPIASNRVDGAATV